MTNSPYSIFRKGVHGLVPRSGCAVDWYLILAVFLAGSLDVGATWGEQGQGTDAPLLVQWRVGSMCLFAVAAGAAGERRCRGGALVMHLHVTTVSDGDHIPIL